MKKVKTTETSKSILEKLRENNVQICNKEVLLQIKGGLINSSEIDIR